MSHYWKFYILIELLSRIYIKRALSYGSFMLRGHRWTKAVVGMKGFPAVASGPSLAHLRLEASSFFALMQFLLLYSLYREMLSFLLESSRQPIKISAAHHQLFLTKFCYLAKVGRERISKHSFFFFSHQSKFSSLYGSYLRTHMPMNTCKFISYRIPDTSLY